MLETLQWWFEVCMTAINRQGQLFTSLEEQFHDDV